jgi:hypothetical protein
MQYTPQTDIGFVHAVHYRDAMIRAWAKRSGHMRKNGAISYRPEELPDYIDPPTNEDRSRAEVLLFTLRPLPYGVSYTAYLSSDSPRIVTWMGDTLAKVTSIKYRKAPGRSSLSDWCGSFWARGIDGRIYYGTHNGRGMYCRMRLARHQPTRSLARKQLWTLTHVSDGASAGEFFGTPAEVTRLAKTCDYSYKLKA